MKPLIVKKLSIVPSDGTVWQCTKCEGTGPRFENDRVKEVLGGGVKCHCGGRMRTIHGSKVKL